MTVYGYARVSVKETDSRNLTLQVEQLVRAGVSLSHIHQEEASGARTDRAALLELLGRLEEGGHPGGHPHRPSGPLPDLRSADH